MAYRLSFIFILALMHQRSWGNHGLLKESLKQNKFSCKVSKSDKLASHCRGKVSGYPEMVNVYFSLNTSNLADVRLHFYFHGWRINGQNPLLGPDGDFAKFLGESQSHDILIIPESQGANSTYKSFLNTPEKLDTFFLNLKRVMSFDFLQILFTLSGHSGAYVTLDRISGWLKSGQIRQIEKLIGIGLFDSLYGYSENLSKINNLLCDQPFSVYHIKFNPNDGSQSKRQANRRLYDELKGKNNCPRTRYDYVEDKATPHLQFPRRHFISFLRSY